MSADDLNQARSALRKAEGKHATNEQRSAWAAIGAAWAAVANADAAERGVVGQGGENRGS